MNHDQLVEIRERPLAVNEKSALIFSDRSFFMDACAGCPVPIMNARSFCWMSAGISGPKLPLFGADFSFLTWVASASADSPVFWACYSPGLFLPRGLLASPRCRVVAVRRTPRDTHVLPRGQVT